MYGKKIGYLLIVLQGVKQIPKLLNTILKNGVDLHGDMD